MHAPGYQATIDPGCWLSDAAGVRDGLDQHSGGAVACTGPERCEKDIVVGMDDG